MKALKLFLSVCLIISMLSLIVGAAEFVPSVERPQNRNIIDWTSENDNPSRALILVPYDLRHQINFLDLFNHRLNAEASDITEQQIRNELDAAVVDLENAFIHHLIDGFDAYWEKITGGAPVENHFVYDIFNIALLCGEDQTMITDEEVTFSFTIDGITKDDVFVLIHKPTDSEHWIIEEHTIDDNNVITVSVDRLSPFAVVKDSGKAPSTDKDSPQTGVSENGVAAAAVCAMIFAAGAVVAGKKLRKA